MRASASLILLLAVSCARRSAPPAVVDAGGPPPLLERIDRALARSGAFLLSNQGADGAVRSATYAYFRDGYSLTPLALAALFALPERPAGYARGVDFLTTMLGPGGKLRDDADGPRYPLYSLAIGSLVLSTKGNELQRATRDAMLAALRGRQLADENGWKPDDLSYGGWSYFDGVPRRPDDFDLDPSEEVAANLSATLFAVGALALAQQAPGDHLLARARIFVERCQSFGGKGDGGFYFSPAIADGNKAGPRDREDGVGFRSYGSMTADGVRALLRLGLPPSHPRVAAASAWLQRSFDAERNPGDFLPVAEVRRGSSYYYWAWSAAHALRDLGLTRVRGDVVWAQALAEALLARQRPDGSWSNPQTEMREDDPVVATSFATAALGVCRLALTAQYRSHSSW